MKIENKEISKCKYRYYVFWYKKHETDAVRVYLLWLTFLNDRFK